MSVSKWCDILIRDSDVLANMLKICGTDKYPSLGKKVEGILMIIISIGYICYPWFGDRDVRHKKLIKIEYPKFLILKMYGYF